MSMAITNGTYKAIASGECVLGVSKNKGTPFLELYFQIQGGPNEGGRVRWTTYFTEATSERSIQALQLMGWEGDNLEDFADGKLHGLDSRAVEIVVEVEEYKDNEGNTRSTPRVQWVNKGGGFLNTDAAMNPAAASAFGARMRGLVLKTKEKHPPPKMSPRDAPAARQAAPAAAPIPEDDIPF